MSRLTYIALLALAMLAAPDWAAARTAGGDDMPSLAGSALVLEVDEGLATLQQGGPSLDQAIRQVRRRYPNGRIVDAKTSKNGRCDVHRIKVLLPDGKVRTESIRGACRGR